MNPLRVLSDGSKFIIQINDTSVLVADDSYLLEPMSTDILVPVFNNAAVKKVLSSIGTIRGGRRFFLDE